MNTPSAPDYWLLSSDSHIVEPPDLWTARAPKDERLPRVVKENDGDWWYVNGRKTMSFLGIQTGKRFEGDPDKLRTSGSFEEVRPAAYDPAAYVKENLGDGVWGSVIFPSEGLVLFSVPDSAVVSAAMAVYNDWIAEFCASNTRQLKGVGMINLDDPREAVRELARCRKLGLGGALISVLPPASKPYRSRDYDEFWAAAVDLAMPLSLHVATDRADPAKGETKLEVKNVPPSAFVNKDFQIRVSLADMILSGVFERFPKLKIGTVEHELGWIPFFLHQIDNVYTERPRRGPDWVFYKNRDVLPSSFFKTNCFCSFQEDEVGIRLRDLIGVETLLWGSDYPHTESTFPRSGQILNRILGDVDAHERRRITADNSAKLYGFDVPPRN